MHSDASKLNRRISGVRAVTKGKRGMVGAQRCAARRQAGLDAKVESRCLSSDSPRYVKQVISYLLPVSQ